MTVMNDRKSGSLIFFTGLALGLLAGGALVWFLATADPVGTDKDLDSHGTVAVEAEAVPQAGETDTAIPVKKAIVPEQFDTSSTVDAITELSEIDRLLVFLDTLTEENADSAFQEDSLDDYREWDYVIEDTFSISNDPVIPRDIRTVKGDPEVLRDVLIYRTDIKVFEIIRDSLGNLIQAEADISPLDVSFWKSPVNYRGYRRSGRQLVLYGIYTIDSVQFLRSGPHLYMDIMDDRYLITDSYDFKHLVRVSKQPAAIPE